MTPKKSFMDYTYEQICNIVKTLVYNSGKTFRISYGFFSSSACSIPLQYPRRTLQNLRKKVLNAVTKHLKQIASHKNETNKKKKKPPKSS